MRNEGVADMARALGCSKAYVSMVLSGKKKPSKRMAAMLKLVNSPDHFERGAATSNPLMGTSSVHGGFDTHSLPPEPRVSHESINLSLQPR